MTHISSSGLTSHNRTGFNFSSGDDSLLETTGILHLSPVRSIISDFSYSTTDCEDSSDTMQCRFSYHNEIDRLVFHDSVNPLYDRLYVAHRYMKVLMLHVCLAVYCPQLGRFTLFICLVYNYHWE